jgi:hypothetical protein
MIFAKRQLAYSQYWIEGETMSAEYRPISAISFKVIDKRLEKNGIRVDMSGAITALIGPDGTLFATPEGNSTHFERKLGVDVQIILDMIETVYGITVVDENDHRFWGFASHDEMLAAYRHPSRPLNVSPRNWILIEGPSIGDADFTAAWLGAAVQADEALQAYFQKNPGFRERLRRLEIASDIEFAPCAMAFVRMWLEGKGVFGTDLFDSEDAGLFSIMAPAGFFMRTGERYQMTVPQRVNLVAIRDALVRLAETEDKDGFLHPEKLLVTMTMKEAEGWKHRLMAMDWQQRLADRELLLDI